ncbi:hypothetical protein WAI88_21975, partial [Acinetobacter baumannii]
ATLSGIISGLTEPSITVSSFTAAETFVTRIFDFWLENKNNPTAKQINPTTENNISEFFLFNIFILQ